MPIPADLLVKQPESIERRVAERVPVEMRAGFRKQGYDAAKADVADLSQTGCKVDSAITLAKGVEVWIKFPGFQPMLSKVVWARGFEAGCEFAEPFHPAVLSNFLQRHRAA